MAAAKSQRKGICGGQTQRKACEIKRLGDVVEEVIEREVLPRQVRFGQLVEVWRGLLPAELCRHCRIADVSSGQIKVLADSSSYAYELQLCGAELLQGLQQQCPRFGIKRIKFAVG